jgi:tetratricopeptide (TPR) repeat protein
VKQKPQRAIEYYETAIKLQNDMVLPYVNASLVYNQIGQNETAAEKLKQAIAIEPNNVAAHLNLALLYGEMARYEQAQAEFRQTFKLDSNSAVAAYNLCILLADTNPDESIRFGQKALQLQPDNARYAYTLAYYLHRAGRTDELIHTLEPFVR